MRSTRVDDYPAAARTHADVLQGRSMLVRKTEPFPIECVARGYLSGSGWKEYQQTGSVCGVKLPAGLRESDRLPEPIFTPATKAATGHDINISEDEAGPDRRPRDHRDAAQYDAAALLARRGARRTPRHHRRRHEIRVRARARWPEQGDIILIDEALTPDSSRFWPRDIYTPGGPQPSFDKQFVRDYLESIRWNKQPPVPTLPDDVIEQNAREIRAGVPSAERPRAGINRTAARSGARAGVPATHERKTRSLIDEMVERGVRFPRRPASSSGGSSPGAGRCGRQPVQGGRRAGHAPEYPEPQDG